MLRQTTVFIFIIEIVRGRKDTALLSPPLSANSVLKNRRARNGRSAGKKERTIDATAAPVVRHVELSRAADSVGGGAVVDVPIIYIILCPMCLCRLRGGGDEGRGEREGGAVAATAAAVCRCH